MQSPFEIFRKHQKILTVILTGLAMFAFVILGAVPDPSNMPPTLVAIVLAGRSRRHRLDSRDHLQQVQGMGDQRRDCRRHPGDRGRLCGRPSRRRAGRHRQHRSASVTRPASPATDRQPVRQQRLSARTQARRDSASAIVRIRTSGPQSRRRRRGTAPPRGGQDRTGSFRRSGQRLHRGHHPEAIGTGRNQGDPGSTGDQRIGVVSLPQSGTEIAGNRQLPVQRHHFAAGDLLGVLPQDEHPAVRGTGSGACGRVRRQDGRTPGIRTGGTVRQASGEPPQRHAPGTIGRGTAGVPSAAQGGTGLRRNPLRSRRGDGRRSLRRGNRRVLPAVLPDDSCARPVARS